MRKAAKVMWFEKGFLWLQQVEKVVIFPMVILSALTMDLEKMKEPDANHWAGAITLGTIHILCKQNFGHI